MLELLLALYALGLVLGGLTVAAVNSYNTNKENALKEKWKETLSNGNYLQLRYLKEDFQNFKKHR